MSKTLDQLISEQQALEQQIAEARAQEKDEAVAKARAFIAKFGLTAVDLGFAQPSRKGMKVAVKYEDSNGNKWTGRGFQPKWVKDYIAAGGDLDKLLVGAKKPAAKKAAAKKAAKQG